MLIGGDSQNTSWSTRAKTCIGIITKKGTLYWEADDKVFPGLLKDPNYYLRLSKSEVTMQKTCTLKKLLKFTE